MKAMVLKAKNSPFVLETVPDPVPGPGEAVARVLACGAGLTIHHTRAGRMPVEYPRIIGHEITGEIVAVGQRRDRAAERRRGHRLLLSHLRPLPLVPHQPRDAVRQPARATSGATWTAATPSTSSCAARSFLKLPPGLDWRKHPAEIGVICDAIATPVKVIRKARVTPHDTVAVFGAGGGLGVHMLKVARWAHARKVIARGRDGLEVRDLRESGGRRHGGRLGRAGRRAAARADRRQGRGRRDRLRVRERHAGGGAEGARQGRALRDARRAAASRSPSTPRTSCARRPSSSAAATPRARKCSIRSSSSRAASCGRSSPRRRRSRRPRRSTSGSTRGSSPGARRS